MTKSYKGQNVTKVRDLKAGDPGFNPSLEQVAVTLPDGTEKIVPRTDVTEKQS